MIEQSTLGLFAYRSLRSVIQIGIILDAIYKKRCDVTDVLENHDYLKSVNLYISLLLEQRRCSFLVDIYP